MKKQQTNPTKTILILTVAFLICYLITKSNWAIYTSLGLGFIGIFSSLLSKIIDFLWMKFAWVLSLIIPNIILSAVFYLLLFPIASFSKLFNKDELQLKNNKKSFFKEVNKIFESKDFTNPWQNKADEIEILVPVNGKNYIFIWDKDLLED